MKISRRKLRSLIESFIREQEDVDYDEGDDGAASRSPRDFDAGVPFMRDYIQKRFKGPNDFGEGTPYVGFGGHKFTPGSRTFDHDRNVDKEVQILAHDCISLADHMKESMGRALSTGEVVKMFDKAVEDPTWFKKLLINFNLYARLVIMGHAITNKSDDMTSETYLDDPGSFGSIDGRLAASSHRPHLERLLGSDKGQIEKMTSDTKQKVLSVIGSL
tara:strand:- start:1900 stop:2550 length:651 start_codon:yes stop_codon:yes gene_type:complete